MNIEKISLLFPVFVVLVFIPALSYSDVKVTLKNGREIIADACQEEDGQLVCTKLGGTFDIEINDVGSVRGIKSGVPEQPSVEPAAPAPREPEKKTDDTPGSNRPDKDGTSAGGQTGALKRLEEITERKKELSLEREKLVKERQQLEEDIKQAPDWMPNNKFDDLNVRNEQLNEKMKRFNDEVGRLSEEEKQIHEGLEKKD